MAAATDRAAAPLGVRSALPKPTRPEPGGELDRWTVLEESPKVETERGMGELQPIYTGKPRRMSEFSRAGREPPAAASSRLVSSVIKPQFADAGRIAPRWPQSLTP